jgi:hypothetical protein
MRLPSVSLLFEAEEHALDCVDSSNGSIGVVSVNRTDVLCLECVHLSPPKVAVHLMDLAGRHPLRPPLSCDAGSAPVKVVAADAAAPADGDISHDGPTTMLQWPSHRRRVQAHCCPRPSSSHSDPPRWACAQKSSVCVVRGFCFQGRQTACGELGMRLYSSLVLHHMTTQGQPHKQHTWRSKCAAKRSTCTQTRNAVGLARKRHKPWTTFFGVTTLFSQSVCRG